MVTIPVSIEKGKLMLPPDTKLPVDARAALLVIPDAVHANDDIDSIEFSLGTLSGNPSLSFLEAEPDLYSVNDLKPENRNPDYLKSKQ